MSALFGVVGEVLGDELGVIAMRGEVDISTSPRFRECFDQLIDDGVRRLVVDLSEVTFLDSTTLGVLVGGAQRIADLGGSIALVVVGRSLLRVLAITELDRVFAVYDSREAAFEALS